MESESLRDRLVRSKASRTGLLSPVFPAPLFRCDLNQTRIYLRTRPSSRRLPFAFSTRCTTCRATEHLQSRRVRRSNAKTRTPPLHHAYRLRRLTSRRGSSCKSLFLSGFVIGGPAKAEPAAEGSSKCRRRPKAPQRGPPNPTAWVWEGRSGAHRPRSGGTQGRNTSSQTLARVEPPKQNRRRPRLRPPAKGTTSTAPRPG